MPLLLDFVHDAPLRHEEELLIFNVRSVGGDVGKVEKLKTRSRAQCATQCIFAVTYVAEMIEEIAETRAIHLCHRFWARGVFL